MIDVVLFGATVAVFLAGFGVLHVLGLRWHRPDRLLTYLNAVYLVNFLFGTAVNAWLLAPHFSSWSTFVIANLGAGTTGFFAAGLYAFLGPATADRSLTAHFLIRLLEAPPGGLATVQVRREYSPANFLEKRYQECSGADLITWDGDRVELTSRGRAIATLYRLQLDVLALTQRGGWMPSFPPARRDLDVDLD